MIWWRWAQLLWRKQLGLTEVVPWGDLVLLADRLRGGRAEIWMSSSVVVQHITLIKPLNASFSSPVAWTAAQNKEIESHLNQGGCRAELTWNERDRLHRQWIPIRHGSPSERLVKRDARHWKATYSGWEIIQHMFSQVLFAHTVMLESYFAFKVWILPRVHPYLLERSCLFHCLRWHILAFLGTLSTTVDTFK